MKRYFIYKDDRSDKFWSVEIDKNVMTVAYGKMRTPGITSVKEFKGEAEAIKEAEKLIKEKVKKGFREVADENAGKFGEIEFWALIEKANRKGEDTYERVGILMELLSEKSEEDIIEFAKIFQKFYTSSYQSKLWAAANIINGGCSNDGFDYFRAWLIAQGKDTYFNTMADPEYLTKIVKPEDAGEIECEDMISVAEYAFSNKTGKSAERIYDVIPPEVFQPPPITIDWKEDGDDLKNMFPKLWKKFAEN